MANPLKKKPMLTGAQRQEIISKLVLASSKGGNGGLLLPHGIFAGLATKFNCDPQTVHRIWHRAKQNFEKDGSFHATPTKKGCCGGKAIYDPLVVEMAAGAVEELPGNQRKMHRQISGALGMSTTVVYRAVHGANFLLCLTPMRSNPFSLKRTSITSVMLWSAWVLKLVGEVEEKKEERETRLCTVTSLTAFMLMRNGSFSLKKICGTTQQKQRRRRRERHPRGGSVRTSHTFSR
jgi:hypothetical protein